MGQDIRGRSGEAALANNQFFHSTSEYQAWISTAMEEFLPELSIRYRALFKAGCVNSFDASIHIGHALVYKLQGGTHMDKGDDNEFPTASSAAGTYTGGEIYFPDLSVKLKSVRAHIFFRLLMFSRYNPGDIVISFTSWLYHKVADWEPLVGSAGDACTPGRVSQVDFWPAASSELLEPHRHQPGWFATSG